MHDHLHLLWVALYWYAALVWVFGAARGKWAIFGPLRAPGSVGTWSCAVGVNA